MNIAERYLLASIAWILCGFFLSAFTGMSFSKLNWGLWAIIFYLLVFGYLYAMAFETIT